MNTTDTPTVARSQDEILARAEAADDCFGWAREVLLTRLDYDHVKPYLNDDVTADDWAACVAKTGTLAEEITGYYRFALGKIEDERGISAERSVIKLREMAWLAGRDDVAAAMDAAPYPEYGAPKVAAFAARFGLEPEGGVDRG